MQIKIGARYRSQVCDTEIIVVRALAGDVALTCGGHPVIDIKGEPEPGLSVEPGADGGTTRGKRHTDSTGKLEVLVTKSGKGTLALDGEPLPVKEAKPLPASD
jgi:hypothetical protein